MPFGRPLKRAFPGQPPSASEYNKLCDEVDRLSRLSVGTGLDLVNTGTQPMLRVPNQRLFAELLSPTASSSSSSSSSSSASCSDGSCFKYGWREVLPTSNCSWVVLPGGRTGKSYLNYAWQANRNCVDTGTIVELFPDGQGNYYFFDGLPGVTIPTFSGAFIRNESNWSVTQGLTLTANFDTKVYDTGSQTGHLYASVTPTFASFLCYPGVYLLSYGIVWNYNDGGLGGSIVLQSYIRGFYGLAPADENYYCGAYLPGLSGSGSRFQTASAIIPVFATPYNFSLQVFWSGSGTANIGGKLGAGDGYYQSFFSITRMGDAPTHL